MEGRQIFLDPTGRRRRAVIVIGLTVAISLVATIAVVVAGLLTPPKLAALHRTTSFFPVVADGGSVLVEDISRLAFNPLSRRGVSPADGAAKRMAFFEMSKALSRFSLLEHMNALDGLLPDFLVLDRNGDLSQRSKDMEQRVRRGLSRASHLQIYPRLTDGSPQNLLASQISSEAASQKLISQIADYLDQSGDAGLAVDFSSLQIVSHPTFFRFLKGLKRSLNSSDRALILILPPTIDRHWLQEFSSAADFILVTLYRDIDKGSAGPLASQGWFEHQLAALKGTVDPSKLIIALGSFGYDFGRPLGLGMISVANAWHFLGEGSIELKFDEKSLNPWFRYTDASGLSHDVWLLDGVTVFNQVKAVLALRPAGVALSSLGMEDPSVWASFGKGALPNQAALAQLTHPPVEFYLDPLAHKPEIVSTTSAMSDNVRQISFNESLGLIVRESLVRFGRGKELVSWPPVGEKLLALTFDDGPDAKVTGKVLDILAAKSVKATFFVVGKSALAEKDLLRRIYREGHDIGNHTYSHPRVADISAQDLELQLTSTQRAFEAILGIHTQLFRPTYAASVDDLENLPIIETASKLGYLTVLSGVDSFDWVVPPPPVKKIYNVILNQVAAGQDKVILFHDQGKKQATLDVLPQIIDGLRSKGFQFVTLHELIGKSRDDIMPKASSADPVENAVAKVRQSGFLAMIALPHLLMILSILVAIITVARLAFVMVAASKHRRCERQREGNSFWPSIAVIVPAYNEEKVICKTIASLLAGSKRGFDIIVVDDGSSDSTAQAVRDAYAHEPCVKVFTKANGGKAKAANFALTLTQTEIVVCIDADTILADDAIPLLVRHFSDPTVGAVAGTAVVGNQINLLTRFQAMEYSIGQFLDRRAFALCNATGVVPGAIGAWRREALLSSGGYSSETLAEDADATFAITRAGWKVIYEPAAEARTEAPETVRAFLRQRHRWMFGSLQVVFKHLRLVYARRTGLGLITIPNTLLSLLGFAFFIPLLDAASIVALASSAESYLTATQPAVADAHLETMAWWMFFQVLYLLAIGMALSVIKIPGRPKLLILLLLQRFLYAPLLYWVAVVTLLKALEGRSRGWRKLARTGSVSLDEARQKATPV